MSGMSRTLGISSRDNNRRACPHRRRSGASRLASGTEKMFVGITPELEEVTAMLTGRTVAVMGFAGICVEPKAKAATQHLQERHKSQEDDARLSNN